MVELKSFRFVVPPVRRRRFIESEKNLPISDELSPQQRAVARLESAARPQNHLKEGKKCEHVRQVDLLTPLSNASDEA